MVDVGAEVDVEVDEDVLFEKVNSGAALILRLAIIGDRNELDSLSPVIAAASGSNV